MNKIEKALLEQMQNKKFQDIVNDDFSFADSLIDKKDLEKFKEANKDARID